MANTNDIFDAVFKDHDQSFLQFLNEFDILVKESTEGKNNKKLVVLDLDNTLINAIKMPKQVKTDSQKLVDLVYQYVGVPYPNNNDDDEKYREDEDYNIKFYLDDEIMVFSVQKRPYLNEFLDFVFENFDVGVWSAGNEIYVNKNISFIFGDYAPSLKFVHHLGFCDKELRRDRKGLFHINVKPIFKLRSLGYSQNKIIHIDDNDDTFHKNPYNALKVSMWDGDKTDNQLLRCIEILKILQVSDNIPNSIVENKFHLGF